MADCADSVTYDQALSNNDGTWRTVSGRGRGRGRGRNVNPKRSSYVNSRNNSATRDSGSQCGIEGKCTVAERFARPELRQVELANAMRRNSIPLELMQTSRVCSHFIQRGRTQDDFDETLYRLCFMNYLHNFTSYNWHRGQLLESRRRLEHELSMATVNEIARQRALAEFPEPPIWPWLLDPPVFSGQCIPEYANLVQPVEHANGHFQRSGFAPAPAPSAKPAIANPPSAAVPLNIPIPPRFPKTTATPLPDGQPTEPKSRTENHPNGVSWAEPLHSKAPRNTQQFDIGRALKIMGKAFTELTMETNGDVASDSDQESTDKSVDDADTPSDNQKMSDIAKQILAFANEAGFVDSWGQQPGQVDENAAHSQTPNGNDKATGPVVAAAEDDLPALL